MEYVTMEELYIAYRDCRKHKRNKPSAIEFEINLDENLYDLHQDLNNGTYTIGKSIAFVITKPKLREVFAADFRDRVVHHLLIRKLEPYFEEYFDPEAYACRKGKGTLYGVKRVLSLIEEEIKTADYTPWILKVDILSFFMSISKEILSKHIELFMRDKCSSWENLEWWIDLAKLIISNCPEENCEKRGWLSLWKKLPKGKSLFHSNGRGLPIGNLSSQFYANFYLTPLDIFLREKGIKHGRYADDIICIGSKEKLLTILPELRKYSENYLELTLHPDKVYLLPYWHGVTAYGTIIKNGLHPGRRTIGNAFSAVILEVNKLSIYNIEPEKRIYRFVSRVNSYFGYLRNTKSYTVRWNYLKRIANTPFKPYLYPDKKFESIKIKEQYKLKNKYCKIMINVTIPVSEYSSEVIKKGSMYYLYVHPQFLEDDMVSAIEISFQEEPTLEAIAAEIAKVVEHQKALVKARIYNYDNSSAVNEFTFGEKALWINRDLRTAMKEAVVSAIDLAEETVVLGIDGDSYEFEVGKARRMFALLEKYALAVNNVTIAHNHAVEVITDLEEIFAYDITANYPAKLHFNVDGTLKD